MIARLLVLQLFACDAPCDGFDLSGRQGGGPVLSCSSQHLPYEG